MSIPTATALIRIESSKVSSITNFLINNQIPFSLNFEQIQCDEKEVNQNAVTDIILNHPDIASSPVQKVQEIFDKYLVREIASTPPSDKEIAALHNISLLVFKQTFHQIYGGTFYQVYLAKKMEYASVLLKKGMTASAVTVKIGYGAKSAIKFNKMFQKHIGMTPKQYQMKYFGSRNRRKKKP